MSDWRKIYLTWSPDVILLSRSMMQGGEEDVTIEKKKGRRKQEGRQKVLTGRDNA